MKTTTIDGVEYIRKADVKNVKVKQAVNHPFEIGEQYLVQCATFYYAGTLKMVTDNELVLTRCAWIADTGKYSAFMATGQAGEVEAMPESYEPIIPRSSVVMAVKMKVSIVTK